MLKVYLYNVGRNLNRAYRTCFSFGIEEMILVGNSNDRSIEWELKGNLYEAKNKVLISRMSELPNSLDGVVALENYYKKSIYTLDWSKISAVLIGGENTGLPKSIDCERVVIPTQNQFCLTVEASLAIALSEWRRSQC